MGNPLIFIHAGVGEIGLLAYLWVLVEMLNPTEGRIRRAKIAATLGIICLFIAWVAGGFYYVDVYGNAVKPLIKASDASWVHGIVMETKEHVFLFLPLLGILVSALISRFGRELIDNKNARNTVITLAGLIVLLGFSIAGMGAIIASGYRFALEAGLT